MHTFKITFSTDDSNYLETYVHIDNDLLVALARGNMPEWVNLSKLRDDTRIVVEYMD
jgi:hypothetical protein